MVVAGTDPPNFSVILILRPVVARLGGRPHPTAGASCLEGVQKVDAHSTLFEPALHIKTEKIVVLIAGSISIDTSPESLEPILLRIVSLAI